MRKNPTAAEKYFWDKVRRRQILGKKIIRQFIIQHEEIMYVKKFFIADFYCHEKKLIIEIDGSIHLNQKEYDEIREEILGQMGYKIIRFENGEVLHNWANVEKVLSSVLR